MTDWQGGMRDSCGLWSVACGGQALVIGSPRTFDSCGRPSEIGLRNQAKQLDFLLSVDSLGPGLAFLFHIPLSAFIPVLLSHWMRSGLLCKLHRHILSPSFSLGSLLGQPLGSQEPPSEKGDCLYRLGGSRPPVREGRRGVQQKEHRIRERARLPSSPFH